MNTNADYQVTDIYLSQPQRPCLIHIMCPLRDWCIYCGPNWTGKDEALFQFSLQDGR